MPIRLGECNRFRRQQASNCRLPGQTLEVGHVHLGGDAPLAQLTVASSRELPGLNGAMAVKVPRANGPTLVGAAGPLSIASDWRKLLEKRTVLPSL